ncbi:MAG: transglycosylase domain-containing protein [bacterium]|nr:transglycosylase domain-containing protein [bacterium]
MYVSRRFSIKNKRFKQKIYLYGLLGLLGITIVGFIFSFILFAWYGRDLPSPTKLSQTTGFSTVYYDRDGKILYEMYKDKNRMPVTMSDIPDYLKKATVSIEDKNFYNHKGVSETGIIRSMISYVFTGKLGGGSTITQQLIKNVLLDSQRAISRKIKEAILAFQVEKKYSKDEILLMYLNEAPYGGTFWGVGTASMSYFDKPVKDLNLVESAILAGLPQNPNVYSPFIGKNDGWKNRARDVLRRMREDGYITKDQEKSANDQVNAYKFSSQKFAINAPHFVFYVKDQVDSEYGAKMIGQGVKIKTTLSLEAQQIVEKIVKEEIAKLAGFNATNAAVVVLDSKTGEILSMVGSYDFNDEKFGKFNAALGLRQPGSTIKPITYAAAFEKGYTPATVVMDVKTTFANQGDKEYSPVNYDGKFRGPVQLRFALGNSFNIPAVKLLAMVGIRDFLQLAYNMGLNTLAPTDANMNKFGLAVTLGGGETTLLDLTSAFSIFASGGIKRDLSSISQIDDFKGTTFFKASKPKEKQIISTDVSFLISHILSDNNARLDEFGPRSYLNVPGKTVAVKTGTTDDKRDNWAIGYTKSITVGVWVGNNDNSQMNPKIASGATGASPIWYRIMTELLKKYSDGIVDKPDKVKALIIDSYLGGLPKDSNSTRSEYFIEGTEPKDISPFYKKLKISKSNGKLANDVEIKSGNYDEKDFIVITENDPLSTDGKNLWQDSINAWAKDQTDSKYHYPTETSDASSDSVIVQIKEPSDHATLGSGNVNIKAKITSIESIKNTKIYLNGNEIKSLDGNRSDIDETIQINTDGVYEIRVVAVNDRDKSGDSIIKIGVNKPWDYQTPTNTPVLTPTL